MGTPGTLYLVPVNVGGSDIPGVLAGSTLRALRTITRYFAENPKTARRFLRAAGMASGLISAAARRRS